MNVRLQWFLCIFQWRCLRTKTTYDLTIFAFFFAPLLLFKKSILRQTPMSIFFLDSLECQFTLKFSIKWVGIRPTATVLSNLEHLQSSLFVLILLKIAEMWSMLEQSRTGLNMSILLEQLAKTSRFSYNSCQKPVDFLRTQEIRLNYCPLTYGSLPSLVIPRSIRAIKPNIHTK